MVYKWLESIQYALFPARCLLCGTAGESRRDLCPGCHGDLPWLVHACVTCAMPLPAAAGGHRCAQCQRRPPGYDAVLAPFRYAPPLDHLIQRLKFHEDLAAGRLLGELLLERVGTTTNDLPRCLIPVPLHPARLAERGFNQALEIGRPIRKALGIPIAPRLVRRVKATATQSLLPAERRAGNLRGAFAVTGGTVPEHVAILDDVLTTGATAGELARVLKRAGAKKVEVWVVARVGRG